MVFIQVVWFGPSLESLNEHNWYGNVSFVISLDTLISRFGPSFFYLDKQEFENHTASRIILSSRSLTLPKVNLDEYGAPLKRLGYSHYITWHYVKHCMSRTYRKMVQHNLEIGIEVTVDDCYWIYQTSTIDANNHYYANLSGTRFGTCTCHRYNTFNCICPDALDEQKAKAKLKADYPDLLR